MFDQDKNQIDQTYKHLELREGLEFDLEKYHVEILSCPTVNEPVKANVPYRRPKFKPIVKKVKIEPEIPEPVVEKEKTNVYKKSLNDFLQSTGAEPKKSNNLQNILDLHGNNESRDMNESRYDDSQLSPPTQFVSGKELLSAAPKSNTGVNDFNYQEDDDQIDQLLSTHSTIPTNQALKADDAIVKVKAASRWNDYNENDSEEEFDPNLPDDQAPIVEKHLNTTNSVAEADLNDLIDMSESEEMSAQELLDLFK